MNIGAFRTAALAAAILATSVAHAADKLRVGVDWFVNPDHGPVIVALEAGFFADAGLEVEIVTPTDTMDNVTMVLEGRADIGMSDQVRTQIEIAGGSPLTIVGTLIPVPLNVVLSVDGGPVRSVADLRGKRIGYADSEKAERDLLKLGLAAYGIPISDVTLVDVSFGMVEALLSGQVDALTDAYRNFEPVQVELAGRKPLIFDIEGAAIPPYSELVYIVERDKVDPDLVRRFLDAVERAARSIADNPDRGWQLFIRYNADLDNTLNRRAWQATVPFFAMRPATLDPARYERLADFLKTNELIEKTVPTSSYLRTE